MVWQLQDAKQRFSELVDRVLDEGPQVVTRRGEQVVVVVSAADFQRLTGPRADFGEFLLGGPKSDELEVTRQRDLPRDSRR